MDLTCEHSMRTQHAGLDAVQLGTLIDGYTDKLHTNGRGKPVAWFLDEIQTVPG